MNAEGLLAHYARIADAPDAIARLRRFVLDLAIRGKLVAQDKHDEPATALLKKIDAEKARLAKEGQIQQGKVPSNRAFAAPLYSVPRGWEWATISAIVNSHVGGGTPSKNNPSYWDGGIFWASVKDVGKSKYLDQTIDTISEAGLTNSSSNLVSPGHVIVVTRMGLGKVSINRVPTAINQDLRALSLSSLVSIDYCYLFFLTHGFEGSGLTVKGIKVEQLLSTPFPLPPLPEQHRIVAKVDEMSALCDQLEAARARREATRDRLAAASLARLNAPDPDTFPADARFALDALPALTTRPDQIKQLRQTILNLAVRGRLVPQDPDDEPASVLLSSIETQMAATTKKAGSRKQRDLEPIDLSEAPFQLPAGWAWGRFPELGTFGRGKSKHRPRNDARLFEKGSHPLIQTGDVARSNGVIETITNYYNDFGLAQSLKWPKGTLCITIAANIADSGILNFAACFPDSVVGFIPAPVFKSARYFEYFVRTAKANLLEFAPATAQKNINLEILSSVLIPLPPLAEQERIVAKVDELMTLCDQLEASLTTGETTRSRLLDALLHEALAPAPTVNIEHPRAAVSGYVVSRLASKRNFGRTAHMKHLYLAESRLGLKLGGRYERQAAGPLDAGIYELEKQAEAAGWYTYNVEKLPSGKEKVSYVPGKALKALAEEGAAVLGSSRKEMDRLIDLMGGLKTEQVEIIATLFAAWNDALLDGHTPGDNWIVKEVREHWHASKQRFAPDDLRTWLGWMRQNDVIPLGHPPRTMQQITMEF